RDVFLRDQLDAVGQRLQPAELSTHARRTQAILNSPRDLALHPNEDQCADRDDIDQQEQMHARGQDESQPRIERHPATERSMQNFVEKECHSCLPEPVRQTHRKTIATSLSVAASPFSNRRASTGRSEVCEIWHKPPAIDKPPSEAPKVRRNESRPKPAV